MSSSSAGTKGATAASTRNRKPKPPNGSSAAPAKGNPVGVGMANGKASGATYGPYGKLDGEDAEGKEYAQPEFGMKCVDLAVERARFEAE